MIRISFGFLVAVAAIGFAADAKVKAPKEPINYNGGLRPDDPSIKQNGEHAKFEDPGCKCASNGTAKNPEEEVALGFNTKLNFKENQDCRAYRFRLLVETLYASCQGHAPSQAEIAEGVRRLEANFQAKKTAEANGQKWEKKTADRHEFINNICMDKKVKKSFRKSWATRHEQMKADREAQCSTTRQVASQSMGGNGTGLVDTGFRPEGSGDAAR